VVVGGGEHIGALIMSELISRATLGRLCTRDRAVVSTVSPGYILGVRNLAMSAKVWTIFFLMETVQCFRPGPAVLFVLSQGLARGALASTWASCGILAGNAVYFLLSATGVAAVLIGSRNAFNLITPDFHFQVGLPIW